MMMKTIAIRLLLIITAAVITNALRCQVQPYGSFSAGILRFRDKDQSIGQEQLQSILALEAGLSFSPFLRAGLTGQLYSAGQSMRGSLLGIQARITKNPVYLTIGAGYHQAQFTAKQGQWYATGGLGIEAFESLSLEGGVYSLAYDDRILNRSSYLLPLYLRFTYTFKRNQQ